MSARTGERYQQALTAAQPWTGHVRKLERANAMRAVEPERELRWTLDHIGLDHEPACPGFHKLDRPVRTASVTQAREPLNTRGLVRHEHYRELLKPFAKAPSEEIADFERARADAHGTTATK